MTEEKFTPLVLLPTEVLISVFTSLPAKQLVKCRQVCIRWKCVIDELMQSDILWHSYCKNDFADVYKSAREKARLTLSWYHIYRSLSLWSKLSQARELRDEFADASSVNNEILDFKILNDGLIGVHKKSSIVYYEVNTFQPSKRPPIKGNYVKYTENNDSIVVMSCHLHLFLVRKKLASLHSETNVTFDNIKTFLMVKDHIYYVNFKDEIYVCDMKDEKLSSKFVQRVEEIICLGYYDDCLHVLTYQRVIYSIVDGEAVVSSVLDNVPTLLHQLKKYNLMEHMDWRMFAHWMNRLGQAVPEGPLRDIIVIRSYGNITFVGSDLGVLRIYYVPSSGYLDIFNIEPIKQYNFMERSDCPVLSTCPILQIDVSETENGHLLFVAMPKKIAVLEFVHCFKRPASVAVLPYSDIQRVKILKIDDH